MLQNISILHQGEDKSVLSLDVPLHEIGVSTGTLKVRAAIQDSPSRLEERARRNFSEFRKDTVKCCSWKN